MNKKIAIIIVNWNSWQDTLECLASLKTVKGLELSVYVVDNGSSDDSIQKLAVYNLLPITHHLIRSGENLGFAGGNNLGIRKALADGATHFLLLNNDTLASPNFLAKLLEVADSNPRVGIVGPKIYFAAAQQQIWFGGGELNWLKTRGTHLEYNIIDQPSTTNNQLLPKDVDYITGCCLLIKREVIEKIGLLDEGYFLYYEDVDWCLRAKKAGYRVVYMPEARIWHKVSRSTSAGSFSYIYYHVRNGLVLSWQYGSAVMHMALFMFIIWTLAKQLIKLLIPSKRMWAKAVLRGLKDFLISKRGKLESTS